MGKETSDADWDESMDERHTGNYEDCNSEYLYSPKYDSDDETDEELSKDDESTDSSGDSQEQNLSDLSNEELWEKCRIADIKEMKEQDFKFQNPTHDWPPELTERQAKMVYEMEYTKEEFCNFFDQFSKKTCC